MVLALAMLLALGVFSVARPPAARADTLPEQPTLTVDPTCEPAPTNPDGDVITITVRGYSFESGRSVAIYWNGAAAPSPADSVAVGNAGSFEVSLTVTEVGSQAYYSIYAYYQDQIVKGSEVAWASLIVPCGAPEAQISITPDCGAAGAPISVHVSGSNFLPNQPITVAVTDLFSTQTIYAQTDPTIPADPDAVSIDIPSFSLPANGAYRVLAVQQAGSNFDIYAPPPRTAAAYLVAPCSQLTITPTCGPSGDGSARYSIQLTGTGFQPGLNLEITFDAGDAPHVPEYFYSDFTTNDDGSWGPVDIAPYERGPGTYDIAVSQSNDTPPLHFTHATFTVDCAPGTIKLDPSCASPQFAGDQPRSFDLSVTGVGFQPGYPVTVIFDPDRLAGIDPETTKAMAQSDGSFSAPSLTVAARPAGTYRVSVQQQVGDTVIDGAVPPFNVPCTAPSPKLRADPTCGDVPSDTVATYSIHLRGRGFIPGFVQIIFDPDGTPEAFTAFADASNGRLDTTITPTARQAGTYRIEARQDDANGPLDDVSFDTFVVPCTPAVTPILVINPGSISPGFVVGVQGTGFPPGSTVELTWSYGIGASRPIEAVAGDDGSFQQQVLIFPHDFTGLRQMTAGTPDDPAAYPSAQASLLVAPGQGSPPVYQVFGGGEAPIVFRR